MIPTEQELTNIFTTMIDTYVRTDSNGVCVMVSPSVFELSGYTPEEVVGKPLASFYETPQQRQNMLEVLAATRGRLRDYEITLLHKSGKRLWVSVSAQYVYDNRGTIVGLDGYVRDISEKKEINEKLERSERELRAIFEHLLDVYYRTDPQGKLLMISPSVRTLLGYEPEELIGRPLSELYIDPAARLQFIEKLKETGGVLYGFENNLRRKDGAEIWAVASSRFYFDEHGKVAGVQGVVKDITERKRAEEELRHFSQVLQEANQDLESFSYSVSHDLRAPLRAIDGYAHILDEEFGSHLGVKGERIIESIHKNVIRMADLIDDLLRFARAGRVEKCVESIDMRAIFMQVIDALADTVVAFEVAPMPNVFGDGSLLRVAVTNLLENAVKFVRKKECPKVAVSCERKDKEYIFKIMDNGIGFEQHEAGRLFRLFEQLNNLHEYPGTGVGLAIVKRIVNRHGGRVWAEGEKGVGATFYFSLPLAPAEYEVSSEARPSPG